MEHFFACLLEFTVLFPFALLSYLPMKRHLRFSVKKLLLAGGLLLFFLCVAGSILSCHFEVKSRYLLLPVIALLGLAYCHSLHVNRLKAVSVLCGVSGVFSSLSSVGIILNAMIAPENRTLWLSMEAGLCYNLICWIVIALAAYPAAKKASLLLEDENMAATWYVFWILPMLFVLTNLFMIPHNPQILYQGRVMQGYLLITLLLLALLVLFYLLFYLMAMGLNKNDRLRQENLFLQMQRNQYDNLQATIAEIRTARHDIRHHFSALSALLERGAFGEGKQYLDSVQENIPSGELNLCDNPALDGVAGHYASLCREHDISFSAVSGLPKDLPAEEMDICVVVSNLLENALETSLRMPPKTGYIRIEARLHSANVIVISVENAFAGNITEKKETFSPPRERVQESVSSQSDRLQKRMVDTAGLLMGTGCLWQM